MASASLQRRIAEVRPCGKCAPHGGLWVPGLDGGRMRCTCLRGQLLLKGEMGRVVFAPLCARSVGAAAVNGNAV